MLVWPVIAPLFSNVHDLYAGIYITKISQGTVAAANPEIEIGLQVIILIIFNSSGLKQLYGMQCMIDGSHASSDILFMHALLFCVSTIQIMSINGVPTNEASPQECITLVSSAPMNLVLELQQNPSGFALVDRVK